MKMEILRLGSVVPHGVGGPESAALNFIFTFLLQEYKQDIYTHVGINQIGNDLEEFVMKKGKRVYVNIRYPSHEDFESKGVKGKNLIRLDVIHTALLRIAAQEGKLDKAQLESIKSKILAKDFSFDLAGKLHVNKVNKNLTARMVIHPEMDKFDYYVLIEEKEKVRCKIKIYSGIPGVYYFTELFSKLKWIDQKQFVVTGTRKEMEIRIFPEECKVEFINLTRYAKPPYFEMMRADISAEEKDKASSDWMHSLPPAAAAIIREAHN